MKQPAMLLPLKCISQEGKVTEVKVQVLMDNILAIVLTKKSQKSPSACKSHTTTACSNVCRCKQKLLICLVKDMGKTEK